MFATVFLRIYPHLLWKCMGGAIQELPGFSRMQFFSCAPVYKIVFSSSRAEEVIGFAAEYNLLSLVPLKSIRPIIKDIRLTARGTPRTDLNGGSHNDKKEFIDYQ